MRWLTILSAFAALPLAGCSVLVGECGTELGELTDRAKARECLGTPVASGTTEDGCAFDDFTTRRKIAETREGNSKFIYFWSTVGLSELYFFPRELAVAGGRALAGYDLRFVYNPDGTTRTVLHDGKGISPSYPSPSGSPARPAESGAETKTPRAPAETEKKIDG